MLVSLITIISMMQFAIAGEFPNGTDTKINFFSCSPENIITVSSIELFDRNGSSMYPIRLKDLTTIKLKSYNNGNVVVKDKVNVDVYAYVKKNGKWLWKNIIPEPFRFLLYNIDGCKMAHNCPLTKGDLELTLPLDLYQYAILFDFIDKSSAHQFTVKLYDAESHQEMSCETIQFRLI
uniref:ML domain-containing protein n=1 Tax=Elaeophora elaphi TaxID=1147741 RepID=A0A0R3RJ94_9BILA